MRNSFLVLLHRLQVACIERVSPVLATFHPSCNFHPHFFDFTRIHPHCERLPVWIAHRLEIEMSPLLVSLGNLIAISRHSQYDIIGLGELHTQEDIDIRGYHLIKQKNRRITHRGPKISGGIAVLVKHDILDICNIEKNTNENSIWISIRQSRTMNKKKCYFGFYYCNPPKKDDTFFTSVNDEIESFQRMGQVYIYGDFNATANETDIIEQDKFDTNFGLQNQVNVPKRNSHDKQITSRGKEFLDICKVNDIIRVNGRKIGDIFGKFTCHYMLTPFDSLENVICFKIGVFILWLSDHCPIMSTVSTNIGKDTPSDVNECLFDEILPRYIWGADSKTRFSKGLDSDLTVEKFRTLLTDESITPVHLAKEITNLLLDNAKTCNLKSTKKGAFRQC